MRVLPIAERAARVALRARGVRSRHITTKLGQLHTLDATGSGPLPPVVLLHGVASSGLAFAQVLFELRRHVARVIVPELPGHGSSDAFDARLTPAALFDAVAGALDELVDSPAILVGNSLGGALALRYARERPERVRGLVLVSPAAAPPSETEWRAITGAFALRSVADARRLVDRVYHRAPWFAPLLARELVHVAARPAVRDLFANAAREDFATPDDLAALAMPILLLWGRSERLLPPTALAFLRTHLPPHAAIEEPDGFGHCPHVDDPRRLAERILRFARDLPNVQRG